MAHFQKTDGASAIQLGPNDNIAVATRELAAGTAVNLGGTSIVLKAKVDVGHKFAVRRIASGERIVKYGAPIGSASRDIEAGEYIHTHNMASDYLPTYTFEEGHEYVKEAK